MQSNRFEGTLLHKIPMAFLLDSYGLLNAG